MQWQSLTHADETTEAEGYGDSPKATRHRAHGAAQTTCGKKTQPPLRLSPRLQLQLFQLTRVNEIKSPRLPSMLSTFLTPELDVKCVFQAGTRRNGHVTFITQFTENRMFLGSFHGRLQSF